MKFSVPEFKRGEKLAGVYKITFDEKHFYIGGTNNFKVRFNQWVHKIGCGKNKNRRIRELAKSCKEIKFEVIETVKSGEHKGREGDYLKEHWGDPLMLNYCQDPNTCLGIKWEDADLKIRKKNIVRTGGKPIAVFDLDGRLIMKFEYLADACRYTGVGDGAIKDFLNGKTPSVKGFKFKWIGGDGYVEPPEFIKKKRVFNGRKVGEQARLNASLAQRKRFENGGKISNKARRVNVYDKEGNLISTQPSIHSVYKLIGIKPDKRIEKILRGKKSKSCHGYTFQFA